MNDPAVPLLIFPCNGNAIEALDCLGDIWRCVGFIDDSPLKQDTHVFGIPVLSRNAIRELPEAMILAVPGSPTSFPARDDLIEGLKIESERFAQVTHPSARISQRASVGRNVLLMAGVVVTSNAVIGAHVCVLPNSVVHHDSVIGDWTLIGSNVTIAGGAVVGHKCYIGSGTNIMNGIRVGEGALIGLGSNVIRDVPAGARVAGNPAKLLPGSLPTTTENLKC